MSRHLSPLVCGLLLLLLLLGALHCQPAVAESPRYWLRLDDLRLPRPKSDVPTPVAKPAEPASADTERKPTPEAAAADPPALMEPRGLKIGGTYSALVIGSQTPDEAHDSYQQAVNRLRLKWSYRLSPAFNLKVEHDTDLTAGNYLQTSLFARQKKAPPQQYLGEGSAWLDRPTVYGTQRFFRAYAKISSDVSDLTVGRQRIALGTGRFWSTLDMLNPINPLQAERDEFVGVDAILAERSVGTLSKIGLVYAPDPQRRSDRWVAQYRTHFGETDLTFTHGKYWSDHVTGIDFATQWGDTGIHGELAYTRADVGSAYKKALLGFDYAFANTLSVSSEIYYSDRSTEDQIAQWTQNPQLALVQPPGGSYFGIALGYELTPLLKISTYLLRNLKDGSQVLYPSISYAASNSINFMGGAQFFSGSGNSEFGAARNMYFFRVQSFF
ncbi:MAG: hypothetical protein V4858_04640 [Pseudomonadota bacterium]